MEERRDEKGGREEERKKARGRKRASEDREGERRKWERGKKRTSEDILPSQGAKCLHSFSTEEKFIRFNMEKSLLL